MQETNLKKWWQSGNYVNEQSWLMIHSGNFNTLKHAMKELLSDKTCNKEEDEELVHINELFQQI